MTPEEKAAQDAVFAKRHPWSRYIGKPEHSCHISSFDQAAREAWHKAHPYRVTWVVPSSQIGCHGWAYRIALFETEAEAMAVAEVSMGVAFSVEVDVSNNGWNGGAKDAKVTSLYKRRNANAKRR